MKRQTFDLLMLRRWQLFKLLMLLALVSSILTSCQSYLAVDDTSSSTTSLVGATSGSGASAASVICLGATLGGVTGTASCASAGSTVVMSLTQEIASNSMRNKSTTQLTTTQESSTYSTANLPTTGGFQYREVPSQSLDDDGGNGTNVTLATHPSSNCGEPTSMSGSGLNPKLISDRIQHCNRSWDGSVNGNAGQGLWKLVTRMSRQVLGAGEVWQDQRTGLLWSSLLSLDTAAALSTATWCAASGNQENPGGGINCAANTASYCNESLTLQPESGPGAYVAARGGMGAQGSTTSPSVYWRLPSRSDYLQADVDGIRFVMPDMGPTAPSAGATEWTALASSASTIQVWTFSSDLGVVNTANGGTASSQVRCVGRGK